MAAAQLLHRAGGQVKVPTFLVPATQKVPSPACACTVILHVSGVEQLALYDTLELVELYPAPLRGGPDNTLQFEHVWLQVWADLYGLPVAGCEGKTAAQIFEAAGCTTPAAPSCAACLGGPKDTFARMNEPQVCVSTTNR